LYAVVGSVKDATVRGFRSSLTRPPPPDFWHLGFHREYLSLRDAAGEFTLHDADCLTKQG